MTTEEISRLPDAELFELAEAASAECRRRERESARFDKGRAAKSAKRDPRRPKCSAKLWRDGKRKDGVQTYVCPVCGAKSCDASNTSLASSKLPMATIERAITLIMLDCPDWVASWILGVSVKTVQFWVDRCLDASQEWAMGSRLSGHVWIDEMRFAPARAEGVAACRTYAGRIAKEAYLEVAFDSSGGGFCKLYAEKLGTPTRDMVLSALGDRIEKGSKLTHDGAHSHNLLVKALGLEDDWCKFVAGDPEYESKMKLMSNCCSYLRHAFESTRASSSRSWRPTRTFSCTVGRTSGKAVLRRRFPAWFLGCVGRLRATHSPIRSRKPRYGRDSYPLFATISSKKTHF